MFNKQYLLLLFGIVKWWAMYIIQILKLFFKSHWISLQCNSDFLLSTVPPKAQSYAVYEFYSLKRKALSIEPRICPSGRFWCLNWRLLSDSVPKCCHQTANHAVYAPMLLWLLRCIPSIHTPNKNSLWKPEQTSSFGVMTWVKTNTASTRKHLSLFATPSARYSASIVYFTLVTILKGRDLEGGRTTLKCLYITACHS